MSAFSEQQQQQLQQWLSALVDDTLSDKEHEQLAALLRHSSEARVIYVDYMHQHATLAWEHVDVSPTASESSQSEETVPAPVASSPGQFARNLTRALIDNPRSTSLISASVAIGLLLVVLSFMVPSAYQAYMQQSGSDAQESKVVVAEVTGTHEAVWAKGQLGVEPGTSLRAGHQLNLVEGMAEMTFSSGATIVLQAPAVFEVLNSQVPDGDGGRWWGAIGRLKRGTLTADMSGVPPKLGIETPWGGVLHVGTEYGVSIDEKQFTDIEVMSGVVELHSHAQSKDESLIARVTTGEITRVARDGSLGTRQELALSPFVRPQEFQQITLAQHVVASWRFDDPKQIGFDESGKTSPLRLVGDAQYSNEGRYGGALLLDGDGDYLEPGGTLRGLPIGNSPYTLAAWIKPTQTGERGIIGWGAYGKVGRANALRLDGQNGFLHYWWTNDLRVDGKVVTNVGVDFSDGKWVHVAVTWDRRVRSLYVNGRLIAQDEPAAPNVTNDNFAIGRTSSVWDECFAGLIDDVVVLNTALDASRLKIVMSGAFADSNPHAPE